MRLEELRTSRISQEMKTGLGQLPSVLKVPIKLFSDTSPRPTGAGDHGDGASPLLAAAFGLNELGAAEEGVSPLALWAVGPVAGGKRRLQHRDALTWKTCAGSNAPTDIG